MSNLTTDITFKHATICDLAFIVDVYNQTIPSRMVTADTEPVTIESRQSWFDAHNVQARPLWLISYQDKPCGWVSLSTFYGRPAYAKTVEISLYIHTDFRGKKIGQSAVRYVERFALEHNIENILCYIFAHNLPSLSLFNKMDYQQWGYLPNVAILDNNHRDLVILGKSIVG